jgi:hypothetical protein
MSLAPLVPIIERELRVASRRAGTYWTRLGAAGAATFITGAFVIVSQLAAIAGATVFGATVFSGYPLFLTLRTLGFAAALAGGLFLASDSLSEERREGTLGLLLLTGLSAGQVVLGKALVAIFRGAQWLLAALPLAGLTLMLGGVTAGEFGGLAIALANALVWSVALSLIASACVQHWTGTVLLTIALLAAGLIVPPVLQVLGVQHAALASPWQTAIEARALQRPPFWISVGLVQLQAWICLALAGARVRRSPDASSSAPQSVDSAAQQVRFGSVAHRRDVRRAWMDPNPVRWLAMRELWFRRLLNGIALLTLAALAALATLGEPEWLLGLAPMAGGMLAFLVSLYISSQASRFFAETARNGFLELLVISPLAPRTMVHGQLWALGRAVLLPAAMAIAMPLVRWANVLVAVLPAVQAGTGTNIVPYFHAQLISACCEILVYPLSLWALAFMGLLMGLRWQRPLRAFVMTVGLGWLAPAFALGIIGAATMPLIFMAPRSAWLIGAAQGIIGMATYGGIGFFASRHLYRHFGELASGTPISSRSAAAAVPPPPLVRPPEHPVESTV